jgi:squalene-hopene/tetraprenyl-beta-curcumene cyclase
VTLSLASSGYREHPAVKKSIEFLEASQRSDGSWPIDTNLATWLTTMTVNALPAFENSAAVKDWLLKQQNTSRHPYTNAPPGGWAWTNLPGGVPDADDTAGALLAMHKIAPEDKDAKKAARAGCRWLAGLQNRDGGIPTFCRGWTNLPFDRSSQDITAHTLRAWHAWRKELNLERPIKRALAYMIRSQNENGAWSPLWFGNEHRADEINWTYGTAKALIGLQPFGVEEAIQKGARYLIKSQFPDGGWGGGEGYKKSSIEETAIAVEALAGIPSAWEATIRGAAWLLDRIEVGTWIEPSPIGFYFAKLWYYEKLYPIIMTTAALGRVAESRRTAPSNLPASSPSRY